MRNVMVVEAIEERSVGLDLPSGENWRLRRLVERINGDIELGQLWLCANVNAVVRDRLTDHGPEHIGIVANNALQLCRLLQQADVQMSIVRDYGLEPDDAEVIVVLAACLHDLGMSIHRDDHEQFSLMLAQPKARALLAALYDEPVRTI